MKRRHRIALRALETDLGAFAALALVGLICGIAEACAQPVPAPVAPVDSGWTSATVAPGFDAGNGSLR